ncbi:hypothetical protein P5673_029000, partial [Acropora cervicornis]
VTTASVVVAFLADQSEEGNDSQGIFLGNRDQDNIVKVPTVIGSSTELTSWEENVREVGDIRDEPNLLCGAELDCESGAAYDVRIFEQLLNVNQVIQQLHVLCWPPLQEMEDKRKGQQNTATPSGCEEETVVDTEEVRQKRRREKMIVNVNAPIMVMVLMMMAGEGNDSGTITFNIPEYNSAR